MVDTARVEQLAVPPVGVPVAVDDPGAGWVPPAPLETNPFAEPVGRWVGGDIPHVYPLPDGRQLWWMNDSFVPDDGAGPVDQTDMVRNAAFIRGLDGTLTLLNPTIGGRLREFLVHPDRDHFHRFFWPLGGEVFGPLLKVFVAEMQCDAPQWGLCFRPVRTWLATYTWADMHLVDLQPAADDGVRPVYGYSVVSDAEYTYLFGTGAEYNTPHIPGGSDRTTVARVPLGHLEQAPEYWNGSTWVADPAAAATLVERGYFNFRLSVTRWGDHYVGVAKEDEFIGGRIVIMTAPAPQGPWTSLQELSTTADPRGSDIVTYDATPYPAPVAGRLAILYSTNSDRERRVFTDPSVYRPALLVTDLD